MTPFSPAALHARLRALVPQAECLCVAFSGGLDSTVLLAALAALRPAYRLRAIHVDHQLQSASGAWARHCEQVAARLGVPLTCIRVNVSCVGEGVEAGARRARYDALRERLAHGEALLTAHHADDQLETLLLAFVRGAGARGLSAMPAVRVFGAGCLARPLLAFSRAQLEHWAREQGLDWIDDPMNAWPELDRGYLRQRVTPVLRERWPSVEVTAVRAAEHLAEAAELLEELAAEDLRLLALDEGRCLDVTRLATLSAARRRNVLRHWLRLRGVGQAPSARKLAALEHDILVAQHDRSPAVAIGDREVRRHRDVLYCLTPLEEIPERDLPWEPTTEFPLPGSGGSLMLVPAARGTGRALAVERLPAMLRVRFRDGGERIKVAHNRPHRTLKKVLQDAQVLPWWRGRVPLIYADERLVAVGDLWADPSYAPAAHERAVAVLWRDKPNITAVR